jgi:uncharacterized protein with HEPN domain
MRRDLLRLADLVEAGQAIVRAVEGVSYQEFDRDQELRDAVLWRFTKLGEAASQLSDALRGRHPDVNWRDPIAFRNRIVHGYFDVDDQLVFDAAKRDVPVWWPM